MSSNNIFIMGFEYFPPANGGDNQRENIIVGGKDMMELLKEYQTFLEVKHRKHNTRTRYLDSATKLVQHISQLDKESIDQYIIYLNKTFKQNTITCHIQGMNCFLNHIGRSDLRRPLPAWRPILRDTITTSQIQSLREYARQHCDTMTYLFILFITDNDCRNHEMIKARWSWIHGDRIHFTDCKTGDTIGQLSNEILETLTLWKTIRPIPQDGHEDYIFLNTRGRYKGRRLSENGWKIRTTIQKITRHVLGRSLCPQDLRASVITEEYNHYINPIVIQRKARHRKQETTLRYNHVTEQMVTDYMHTGTIFSTNNKPLLKPKPDVNESIGPYIYTLPPQEQTTSMEDEMTQDNCVFSFSFTFFSGFFDYRHVSRSLKSIIDNHGGERKLIFKFLDLSSEASNPSLSPQTVINNKFRSG